MIEKSDENHYEIEIKSLDNKKIKEIRKILNDENKTLTISSQKNSFKKINFNKNSCFKIFSKLIEPYSYPEEMIFFITPDEEDNLSNSIEKRDNNNYLKKKSDLKEDKNYKNMKINNNINFTEKEKNEYLLGEKENQENIYENYELFYAGKRNNHFFYYCIKVLYIYYLICSILIFIHFMTFVGDIEYRRFSSYAIFCILLVISMATLGCIGIFVYNGMDLTPNKNIYILNEKTLFWFNFIILLLTMSTFTCLIKEHNNFLKSQITIGVLIILLYIISIIFEAFILLFYDLTDFFRVKEEGKYSILSSDEEECQI